MIIALIAATFYWFPLSVEDCDVSIVTNDGFVVGYDNKRLNPAWVQYDLEPCEVIKMKRVPNDFKEDPRVPMTCDDNVVNFYKAYGGIFDRGHLAPAADFNWSTNALRQTYYFSNISPMTPKLNRGAWLEHENEVRRLAESGTVHVVIFPQYQEGLKPNGYVMIPTHFVKVAWGWFGVKVWKERNEQ